MERAGVSDDLAVAVLLIDNLGEGSTRAACDNGSARANRRDIIPSGASYGRALGREKRLWTDKLNRFPQNEHALPFQIPLRFLCQIS